MIHDWNVTVLISVFEHVSGHVANVNCETLCGTVYTFFFLFFFCINSEKGAASCNCHFTGSKGYTVSPAFSGKFVLMPGI